jgi:hypothetical protein
MTIKIFIQNHERPKKTRRSMVGAILKIAPTIENLRFSSFFEDVFVPPNNPGTTGIGQDVAPVKATT